MAIVVALGGLFWLVSVAVYVTMWAVLALVAPFPVAALASRFASHLTRGASATVAVVGGWALLMMLIYSGDEDREILREAMESQTGRDYAIQDLLTHMACSLPFIGAGVAVYYRLVHPRLMARWSRRRSGGEA